MAENPQTLDQSENQDNELRVREIHIPFPDTFVYSNCAAFALSAWDFRISFAEALPNGIAVAKVGVAMPPETAAMVALTLLHQLAAFEKNFGEVRLQAWKHAKEVMGAMPTSEIVKPKPT